jgi:hypothetical protein
MTSLFFIALGGFFNSIMDILFTGYGKSIFASLNNPLFWNPQVSWKNKWAQPFPQPSENKWYYFGFPPPYKERFPYSSTIFVFLTDGWHLSKALMLLCIMLSVVTYEPIISFWGDVALWYTMFTTVFTIFYSYVWVGKKLF